MGLGKTIIGCGVYNFYSPNLNQSLLDLSERLNANFKVRIIDNEVREQETKFENKLYLYYMEVYFEEVDTKIINPRLPIYFVYIPINFIYANDLLLIFSPNKSLIIQSLCFEHKWDWFISELKDEVQNSNKSQVMDRYQQLRNKYKSILKKLELKKIFIVAESYYELEGIDNFEEYPEVTDQTIINIAKEKDKLKIFDFQEILDCKQNNQIDKSFKNTYDYDMMLVDHLTQ